MIYELTLAVRQQYLQTLRDAGSPEIDLYLNLLDTVRDIIPEDQDRLIDDFDRCLNRAAASGLIPNITAVNLPWGDDGLGAWHSNWVWR